MGWRKAALLFVVGCVASELANVAVEYVRPDGPTRHSIAPQPHRAVVPPCVGCGRSAFDRRGVEALRLAVMDGAAWLAAGVGVNVGGISLAVFSQVRRVDVTPSCVEALGTEGIVPG